MSERTSCPLGTPHTFVSLKDPELDRDRTTPLSIEVAQGFADALNRKLSTPGSMALLNSDRLGMFAQIINEEVLFPFTAKTHDDTLSLAPALEKSGSPFMVKDISDGVTEICKRFSSQAMPSEAAKFALAMLFQPALYQTYHAAGLTEGAHTKYTVRSC